MTAKNLSLIVIATAAEINEMDRAQLRSFYREALGQPADRRILDSASAMRRDILAAKAAAAKAADDVGGISCETVEFLPEMDKAEPAQIEQVEQVEQVEPARRGSKWTGIVSDLWALRGEGEIEVKVSVEQLLALGLPTSAVRQPAYWNDNPPGRAARELGLVTSLRKAGESRYLLIRKA
jgi:hypothetical protein